MDNYPYIIASLPDLALDFAKHDYDYSLIRENIFDCLDQTDRRLVEWLETGFDENNLNKDFYRSCARCGNKFIRDYFAYDFALRTEKVAYLEKRETEQDFEEKEALRKAFAVSNILERERQISSVTWNKIEDIVLFDLFNINPVLAFLAKMHIISRWSSLDKATGEKLFAQFVEEINNTYNKNKINQ
ncbi:MAG: DUF2764 family protein [Bacteroidales bacterium]|nr:DUF2764 family protein [Candidatus Equibacterium intestinale]